MIFLIVPEVDVPLVSWIDDIFMKLGEHPISDPVVNDAQGRPPSFMCMYLRAMISNDIDRSAVPLRKQEDFMEWLERWKSDYDPMHGPASHAEKIGLSTGGQKRPFPLPTTINQFGWSEPLGSLQKQGPWLGVQPERTTARQRLMTFPRRKMISDQEQSHPLDSLSNAATSESMSTSSTKNDGEQSDASVLTEPVPRKKKRTATSKSLRNKRYHERYHLFWKMPFFG